MELTPEEQELQEMDNVTSKRKAGKLGKSKAAGVVGSTGSERHSASAKLAQSEAVKDLAAFGQTYTQTFQAGLAAFNGVAKSQIESLIDSDFEALDPSQESFDFFGQMFAGFVQAD